MVGPARKREAVAHLEGILEVSERRACKAIVQPRSTQRYRERRRDKDAALAAELRRISAAQPRAGYRIDLSSKTWTGVWRFLVWLDWLFFVWGEHLFLEVEGRTITEGTVPAVRVVECFDGVEGHECCRGAGGREVVGEAFGLEGGDEAFGQGVVVGIGGAAYAQGDAAGGGEREGGGGQLDAHVVAAVVSHAAARAARP